LPRPRGAGPVAARGAIAPVITGTGQGRWSPTRWRTASASGRAPRAPGAGAAHARRGGRTGPGRPRMSTVAELMSRRGVAAWEDAGFKEIAVVLRANGISALPVVAADRRVIGVVSAADLLDRKSVV